MLVDVASEAQDDGLRMNVDIDRELAGRLGVSLQTVNDTLNDAFGQRQISTIYAPGQPISRDPGGDAGISARPKLAVQALRAGRRRRASAAVDARTFRAHDRATRHRAPGAVPVGHDQLQSRTRSGAERRGHGDHGRRARDRDADVGDRELFGRRGRIRQVAGKRAVADPRRSDHDLHRARRAV